MNIKKNQLENKTILVVGDMILDEYLLGRVERISPEAPVPILNVMNIDKRLGGAANVALNCRSLGCNVDIVSVTGDDTNAKNLIKKLKENQINCYIEKNKNYNTVKKTRLISNSQQILRIDEEENPPKITDLTFSVFKNRLKSSNTIIFSDYGKGVLDTLPSLIKEAKSLDKICLVDPKGSDPSKFRDVDILTPNSKEMTKLIGEFHDENDLKIKVFRMMNNHAIQNIVLTKGKEGLTLFQKKDNLVFNIKGTPCEVFDVTGAGDTVISVLSVLLSIDYSLSDACEIANKAGGIIVQKFGTTSIRLEEIF